ncbi:M14 family metallopeptidase [Thalassobaculum sp. OXR-137]|uniref:M14 family metallopeptidase n=1 Tax=Thalassobaculum sp. OXR-137 TaxID=3100173 RepID=UPI002AC91AB5|nr:M14 family metallopeptidase [Thalassobaculum sp. OXR-137]WPZ32808.1 M14 family metallopeptidase [Thalassobaculum sp. OXR-137]
MSATNAYPVELEAPDISAHRNGNTGIDYVHTFDSGKPGPDAMINAVIHGNELCGAIALDYLMKQDIRPTRGKLTVAFVNPEAYLRFDPAEPAKTRFVDEDMNRVWTQERLNGPDSSVELRRARELRPLYDRVERLLDIHSMGTYSDPIMLIHGLEKERRFTREIGYPAMIACGSGHVDGLRLIEYAPFNDPASDRIACLVECGQHWAASSADVAIDTALEYLHALDMIDAETLAAHRRTAPVTQVTMADVTHGYAIRTDDFFFAEYFKGLERFAKAGTVVAVDGGEEIVTPYDDCILVMPNHRAVKGQRAFRLAKLSDAAG